MATGITIADLDWGMRTPDKFIDAAVKSTEVLGLFTLIDGVKSKVQVPIFDAALVFGTDFCVWDPESTATIDEKEMVVSNYKWAFQNCKEALQSSYRSVLLRKGANNPETMDSGFKDWLFDYFGKLAGQYILGLSITEIATEIGTDASVVEPTQSLNDFTDPAEILGAMQEAYLAIPQPQLDSLAGVTDREYRPAFFMNAEQVRAFQVASAAAYTTVYGEESGEVPKYMGLEVITYAGLTDQVIMVTNPANLTMVVDDYADTSAIQTMYKEELSSDYIWGQFTIGFSYMISENIVWYLGTAA